MNWRKLFRRGLMAIFILASLLTAVVVCAAIQIFDGTGQYIMSDFENHDIAKQRAQQRAELDAQKKAGVYLTSFSKSENMRLTVDEISAVTNNIIKVSDVKIVPVPFETNGEAGLMYRVTLKASIDPDGLISYIKRDEIDKVTIVQQNNGLQDAIAKNDALIEDLKEQYKRTKSDTEKRRLRKRMSDADREFLANEKLQEGLKLAYQEDYSRSINFFDEAIKLNPNYFWAYQNRGTAYRNLKKYDRGLKDLNKAIELNPSHSYPYINRGLLYFALKKYEKTVEDCSKAIELNPNFAEAYLARSVAYIALEENDKAVADSNKAKELKSKSVVKNFDPASYLSSAIAHLMKGEYQQAIDDFNKAEEILPIKNDTIFFMRGTAYLKLKQCEQAILDFNKAIELNPNHVEAYYNRGLSYAFLGNFNQAIDDVTKGIQINPNDAKAYQLRGICYQQLGENAKAQADFAKAKDLGWKG